MKNRILEAGAVIGVLCAGSPCFSGSLAVEWRWSQKGIELDSPAFSPDGREIALVRKPHEPDGAEAESFSEDELAALQRRAAQEPRWADPEVIILGDAGRSRETVGYGWSPSFSPDARTLVFAAQKKPISGLRVLAETLAGNEIAAFDRRTKRLETWARPARGHLDRPIFSADGLRVAYALGDAANGSWPGQVGVGLIDVRSRTTRELLAEEQRFGAVTQVPVHAWCGTQLLAVRQQPASAGDSGMAGSYTVDLLAVSDKMRTIHSWGVMNMEDSGSNPGIAVTPDGAVLLFDKEWLKVDPRTSQAMAEPVGKGFSRPGVLSPSGTKLLRVDDGRLFVDSIAAAGKTASWNARGEMSSAVWSADSKRIAVILTRKKDEDVFDSDELVVLAAP